MYSGALAIGTTAAVIVLAGTLATYAAIQIRRVVECMISHIKLGWEELRMAHRMLARESRAASDELQHAIEKAQADCGAATEALLENTYAANQKILQLVEEQHQRSLRFMQDSILSVETSRAETDEKILQAAGSISSAYFLVEHSLRELRGRLPQAPGGVKPADICSKCQRPTNQYFVDGRGATICMNCNKEGFLEAVRRGTAKV
jgi:hypothetical protein